jgi:uncharacterized damage-inducible protein DinB
VKAKTARMRRLFLASAQRTLAQHDLPRIVKCLEQLSEEEIWWRPNSAANSAGNLVLHLCGNVRQWMISGLGGAKDTRKRDLEFSERGPIPRKTLVTQLRQTVREESRILARLSDESLTRNYEIQGYRVTGLDTVFRVAEHFGYHTGQIIYITKLKRAQDLKLTRLPMLKKKTKSR